MGRFALRLAALLACTALAAGASLALVATRRLERRYDAPTPDIARATSADELARGQRLYRTLCASCHAEPGDVRACGAVLHNFPASFGTIRSSNLSADPEHGIGARSDGEIARLLRHGVRFDGRWSRTMPRIKGLGDEDIAALLGFLRSGDPRFAACPPGAAGGHLALSGKIALAFFGPSAPPGAEGSFSTSAIPIPARGPNAAYGRYLATAIYGCVACHTDGLEEADAKLASPGLLAGGFELPDPRGEPVLSTNLTPDDETGIGRWTLAQFQSTLATGIDPTGAVLRSPMPILRVAEPVEVEAIFTYLRSLPAVKRAGRAPRPKVALAPGAPPEEAFPALGCASCHGGGAPFRNILRQAAGKPAAALAEAIRHPERGNPDSQMPTFAAILDASSATALASWVQETNQPDGDLPTETAKSIKK